MTEGAHCDRRAPARGAAVSAAAGVRRAGERAARDLRARLRGVLGDGGARAASPGSSRSRELYEWDLPYAKWYVGGKLNVCFNCVDRHVEAGLGDKVAYHWEGEPEDERRTITFADLQREVVRFANALEGARRRQGHAGRDLHGDDPGAARLHARVRAARRAPHRRLRRLQRRLALRPAQRHGVRGPDHAGRGLAQGRRGAAEAERRRGARALTGREDVGRLAPRRQRGGDARGPRRLGARARRGPERRPGHVPVRADGLGGPPLPPLHERHHREAEGDRPHDRRLPHRRRDDAPLHLRREARLGVLVRRRHRLGHRPQLHRLRAARERDHRRPLRGRARLPRPRPLVGDRRALQGGHPLHGPDRDPRAHEMGPRARGEARPLLAAAPRLGGRADQPGGLDLVPGAHRRRTLPDRGHLVADRDGHGPDHAAPGRDDDEAGLRDAPVPRRRRGGRQRPGRGGAARRRRLPRAAPAVARDAARASTRITTASSRPTGAASRACTSPATAPASTRTATSGSWAASTTS